MMRPRVVFLPCLLVLLASIAPALAGTGAAPEVTDVPEDNVVAIGSTCAAACQFTNGDLLNTYVEQAGTNLLVHVGVSGTGAPSNSVTYAYEFHFKGATADYLATAASSPAAPLGDGSVTAGGIATAAVAGTNEFILTIPMTAVAGETTLTSLYVLAHGVLKSDPLALSDDRAPDGTAFGADYVLAAPAANTTTGTGGNNTIGNTTTTPTSGSTTTAPSGSTTSTASSTSATTQPASSAATTTSPAVAADAVSAIDKITGEQQGYAIASAAGAAGVVLLSLIGRFGRWG